MKLSNAYTWEKAVEAIYIPLPRYRSYAAFQWACNEGIVFG